VPGIQGVCDAARHLDRVVRYLPFLACILANASGSDAYLVRRIPLRDLPRGDTRPFTSASAVLQSVASLIEELDCADRCVEYSVDDSVRTWDGVDAWLSEAIRDGYDNIRYIVTPDHAGLVRVDFVAIAALPGASEAD